MNLKVLLFLTISFTFLYSENKIELVTQIEKHFKAKQNKKACYLVDILYQKNPYDYKANLYYGKCAYYKKDIDTAIAAYDRAEILNETDAVLHKEIADLHVAIGNIEIANREYDKADSFGTQNVKRAEICNHNPHKFSLLAKLTTGYDSNVEYNAELSELNDWSNIGGLSEPESDFFVKEYLRLSHLYNYNPYTTFYYKSQLYIYNKNYKITF